jgi:hypothetical protein|tara:strand:- start:106 stop:327 length:222 start_codon:yes stop_codon:yes gene_type:complete
MRTFKKLFLVCVILNLCTNCTEFAMIMSGSSIAISQNAYSKAYSGVDMITIIKTKKDIKKHLYDNLKKVKEKE